MKRPSLVGREPGTALSRRPYALGLPCRSDSCVWRCRRSVGDGAIIVSELTRLLYKRIAVRVSERPTFQRRRDSPQQPKDGQVPHHSRGEHNERRPDVAERVGNPTSLSALRSYSPSRRFSVTLKRIPPYGRGLMGERRRRLQRRGDLTRLGGARLSTARRVNAVRMRVPATSS